MKFRTEIVELSVFIDSGEDQRTVVEQLLEFVAYAFSCLRLQHSTIASHLSAVKFFHRLACAVELDTRHPLLSNALKGAARGHADEGTEQRIRRPLPLLVLRNGASLVPQWGAGGRILFLSLTASFFFLARSCEMFAVSQTAMHAVHGLRRGDVAFFHGSVQLTSRDKWALADRVEVRFRSSKGDQFRKGAVCTRTRQHAPCPVESGGGAVDVMVELLSAFPFLPSHAPLVAVGAGGNSWWMWTKNKACDALRQMVALAGLPPQEYALHSLRIGGATDLAAGGASPEVLRKEGRWAGESGFRPYVRSHGRDAMWVSSVLAAGGSEIVQPGQRTEWGKVTPPV